MYELAVINSQGATPPEFLHSKFKSMRSALEAFDNIYSPKGFMISIHLDGDIEPVKIVKSTFR
jgi:hypothetical protein